MLAGRPRSLFRFVLDTNRKPCSIPAMIRAIHLFFCRRAIHSNALRLAAARGQLEYLYDCYASDSYNSDLHADILQERDRIRALEERQDVLAAELAQLAQPT